MDQEFDFTNLRPAIAGFLIDGKIEYKETISALVDLIQRGYIYYQSDELALVKQDDSLMLHEKEIINQLFSGREFFPEKLGIDKYIDYNTIVSFIRLDCIRMGLASIGQATQSAAISRAFSPEDRYTTSEYKQQKLPQIAWQWINSPLFKATIIDLAILIIGNIITPYSPAIGMIISTLSGMALFFIGFFWVCVAIMICLIFFIGTKIQIKNFRINLTQKGEDLRNKYVSLKEFLTLNKNSIDLNLSREYVPYAIAFGQTTIWNERLNKFPQIKPTPTDHKILRYYAKTLKSNYVIDDQELEITHLRGKDPQWGIYLYKKGTETILKTDSYYDENEENDEEDEKKENYRIGTITTQGIIFDKHQSQNILFNGTDGVIEGEKLICDNDILSNGKRPLLRSYTIVKNSQDIKRFIELYDNPDIDTLINELALHFYHQTVSVYLSNKGFIDQMRKKPSSSMHHWRH